MKSVLKWKESMKFSATCDNNTVDMDAKSPIGQGSAMTPKELVATGLGGCTAMDVIALLKKHKQPFEGLQVDVDIETSKGSHPMVFLKADIYFRATGAIDKNILIEAVKLSQTKFCGVSAMLVKAFPINYFVILNNEQVDSGQAHFEN